MCVRRGGGGRGAGAGGGRGYLALNHDLLWCYGY